MLKKILVGLDDTPSTDAVIRQSIEVAQHHEARLTGITAVNAKKLEGVGMVPVGAGTYAKRLREHRISLINENVERSIAKFESACNAAGISYDVKHVTGDPFDLAVSSARSHDLMMLGLTFPLYYGVGEPENALCRLIERGVRPVIAVAPEFRTIRKALIAHNGSVESTMTMKQFIQLRVWPNVTAHIVRFGEETSEAKRLLSDASEYSRIHGVDVDIHCVPGTAKRQLLEYAAQWNADLIVMGNSVRRFPVPTVFGDTTFHVMQHSPLPLFLSQ